jgi:hypothetical protein
MDLHHLLLGLVKLHLHEALFLMFLKKITKLPLGDGGSRLTKSKQSNEKRVPSLVRPEK